MKLEEYLQKEERLSSETAKLIDSLCDYTELPKGC
jgi:hypothetical protein